MPFPYDRYLRDFSADMDGEKMFLVRKQVAQRKERSERERMEQYFLCMEKMPERIGQARQHFLGREAQEDGRLELPRFFSVGVSRFIAVEADLDGPFLDMSRVALPSPRRVKGRVFPDQVQDQLRADAKRLRVFEHDGFRHRVVPGGGENADDRAYRTDLLRIGGCGMRGSTGDDLRRRFHCGKQAFRSEFSLVCDRRPGRIDDTRSLPRRELYQSATDAPALDIEYDRRSFF